MSTQARAHVIGVRRNGAWLVEPMKTPNSGARCVLFVLADFADEKGECWPGLDAIADAADLSEDTARRHLRTLEDAGIVTVVVNGAPDQRIPLNRRPNLYRIVGVAPTRGQTETDPDPATEHPKTVETTGQTGADNGHNSPRDGGVAPTRGLDGSDPAPTRLRGGTGAAQTPRPRGPNRQEPVRTNTSPPYGRRDDHQNRRDYADAETTRELLDQARADRNDPNRPDPTSTLADIRSRT